MTVEPLPIDADGVRVLRAAGELDLAVVPAMLPAVPGLVAGATGVVLDLSGVEFFDSSGVRLVDRLVAECAATGARLVVAAAPGTLPRRVLEIVGMAGPLVADDVTAALRRVRG